jgi:hypothetical protein
MANEMNELSMVAEVEVSTKNTQTVAIERLPWFVSPQFAVLWNQIKVLSLRSCLLSLVAFKVFSTAVGFNTTTRTHFTGGCARAKNSPNHRFQM